MTGCVVFHCPIKADCLSCIQPQLLQEQNLELASRLAEMQAFISHQATSAKTAKTANVSSFLKNHRKQQLQQQGGAKA